MSVRQLYFIMSSIGLFLSIDSYPAEIPEDQEISSASLTGLPAELQQHIMTFVASENTVLEAVENIQHFAQVNKQFAEILRDEVFMKNLMHYLYQEIVAKKTSRAEQLDATIQLSRSFANEVSQQVATNRLGELIEKSEIDDLWGYFLSKIKQKQFIALQAMFPYVSKIEGFTEKIFGLMKKAIGDNDITTVTLLLNAGVNPNIIDAEGNTPLSLAIINDNTTIFQVLLKHAANPKKLNRVGALLNLAVLNNNETIVQFLLKHGANPNILAMGGYPLSLAVLNNNETIVQLLLEHGADPNIADSRNNTLLHDAALNNNRTIAQLLLKNGADPNIANNEGDTPLGVAQRMGSDEIIKLLKQAMTKKGTGPGEKE